ncbi:MAG: queuosine precursor transporter, partial [Spirochaetales bacterium]|nr:queuosine precursor transporter [Spirochaetales bacterium]
MQIALVFTPAEEDFAQASLKVLFGIMPRIALASLIAYGLSQMHDVWAYHFWKRIRPQKGFIWLRNNLSTMVSQAIDTLVFTSIAFAGVFTGPVFWEIMATTYLFKFIVALADTPFIYIARNWKDRGKVA